MQQIKRFIKHVSCALIAASLLSCAAIDPFPYVYPISYPIEERNYYICTKLLNNTYRIFRIGEKSPLRKEAFIKEARSYLSDARVDQALEEYDSCIEKTEKARWILITHLSPYQPPFGVACACATVPVAESCDCECDTNSDHGKCEK